jgi:hypothetical protein
MSARYIHPSEDAVLLAMARLGGHKIGHSENRGNYRRLGKPTQLNESKKEIWFQYFIGWNDPIFFTH